MTCPKCGGLIITEHDEARCINCGRRPGEAMRDPEPEEKIELTAHGQLKKRRKPMGKWSPEAKAAHKKKMQEIWAQKRAGGGGVQTALVPSKPQVPVVRPVRRAVLSGSVVEALDQAIAELDSDRATLERAKEILERR